MQSTTPKRLRSPLASSSKRTTNTPGGDRFIPTRAVDLSASQFNLQQELQQQQQQQQQQTSATSCIVVENANNLTDITVAQEDYSAALRESMFPENGEGKILAFKNKAPEGRNGNHNPHRVLFSASASSGRLSRDESEKKRRVIPTAPTRILDAPAIADDYYLNVLDWGSCNTLAVALEQSVYLWNAETGGIDTLLTTADASNYAASVKWMPDSSYLAVGLQTGATEIWDPVAMRKVRTMQGHSQRVCSLSWNPATPHLLSSGSMDTRIMHFDVRQRDPIIATSTAHSLEVCGLEWSPDGSQLASGGNDNLLCIWNVNQYDTPAHRITHHQAAVKALAWNPHRRNLLASGGGTADRRLCFWNSLTGACIKEVDTKSQVCAIKWSKNYKDELITSHGFSNNQLTIWNYSRMTKLAELSGHTSRVLYMAESPDGETIVSAAGDETLRFWKAFAKPEMSTSGKPSSSSAISSSSSSSAQSLHAKLR